MSGNTYGNAWKFMVTRSKKAFKSKEFEKHGKVLGYIIKY